MQSVATNSRRFFGRLPLDFYLAVILVAVITSIGSEFSAFTGDLKGDDAYFRISRVQFIVANFPHIGWFSQSFAGHVPMGFDAPFLYFLIAAAHVVTNVSIEVLFQTTLFISMTGLGLSVYLFARTLSLSPLVSFILALLLFTMPETWNAFVIGGAYLRIPAMPLVFLSLALAFRHIRQFNAGAESVASFLTVVSIYTLLAIVHPLLWQWTFSFIILAYIIGITGWVNKLTTVFKTFLPIVGLTAWTYLPLIRARATVFDTLNTNAPIHDTDLMHWSWLLQVPSADSWAITLGPLILPVAIVSLVILAFQTRHFRAVRRALHLEFTFLLIFVSFSLYFFSFGWLPMPGGLYRMAAFDHVLWLGFTLVLVTIVVASIMQRLPNTKPLTWLINSRAYFPATVAVSVFISGGLFSTVPFLSAFTYVDNPMNPSSLHHEIAKVVDLGAANSPDGYRLHNAQREVTKWLYAYDPEIGTTGGRSRNDAPHKYFHQLADASISYRLDETGISSIYFEDQPQVVRSTIGGQENFYESMFWLDWYGASGAVFLPPLYPQQRTVLGYESRPQFFEHYGIDTGIGQLAFSRYVEGSPVAIGPRGMTVAAPFLPEENHPFYTDLLLLLSSLNLNSQWVIPVKLEKAEGLENFDAALVTSNDYRENKATMDQFAAEGGHLLVMRLDDEEANVVDAWVPGLRIHFPVNARSVTAPEGSRVLAEASEGPLVFSAAAGQGSLAVSSIPLRSFVESDSVAAVFLLMEALGADFDVTRTVADVTSSRVSLAEGSYAGVALPADPTVPYQWDVSRNEVQTNGQITLEVSTADTIAVLTVEDSRLPSDFVARIPEETRLDLGGFVEFETRSGQTPTLGVSFGPTEGFPTLPVTVGTDDWIRSVIPLSAFESQEASNGLSNRIVFTVDGRRTADGAGYAGRSVVEIRRFLVHPSDAGYELPILQVIDASGSGRNQSNWEMRLPESLPADSNSLVSFSMWHDGNPVDSIAVTLIDTGTGGFLGYTLSLAVWEGWKDFAIPLSAFRWSLGDRIATYDSVAFVFNQVSMDLSSPSGLHTFMVRDVNVTAFGDRPGYVGVEGNWRQSNEFEVSLEGSRILWKQSWMPGWKVTDDEGGPVNYYYAGPGLIYLEAPSEVQNLKFEIPVAWDLKLGLAISFVSLIGIAAYAAVIRFRRPFVPVKDRSA